MQELEGMYLADARENNPDLNIVEEIRDGYTRDSEIVRVETQDGIIVRIIS